MDGTGKLQRDFEVDKNRASGVRVRLWGQLLVGERAAAGAEGPAGLCLRRVSGPRAWGKGPECVVYCSLLQCLQD